MRNFTGSLSGLLAIIGMAVAIGGVAIGEFKPILIGLVLLAGGSVFALIHIGMRPLAGREAAADRRPHEVESY